MIMKTGVNPEKAFVVSVLALGMGLIFELGVLPAFGVMAIWIWVLAIGLKKD